MALHTELTPTEAADRLALRELFDAYAQCADRRDAEGQKALFTDDTIFAVYMEGEGSEPSYVLHGRESLTAVFDDLNRYETTTHFNGQSTVTIDGGDRVPAGVHVQQIAWAWPLVDVGWLLALARPEPRTERGHIRGRV